MKVEVLCRVLNAVNWLVSHRLVLEDFHLDRALCCFAKPFETFVQSFLYRKIFIWLPDCCGRPPASSFSYPSRHCGWLPGRHVRLSGRRFGCLRTFDCFYPEPAVAGVLQILQIFCHAAVAGAYRLLFGLVVPPLRVVFKFTYFRFATVVAGEARLLVVWPRFPPTPDMGFSFAGCL